MYLFFINYLENHNLKPPLPTKANKMMSVAKYQKKVYAGNFS